MNKAVLKPPLRILHLEDNLRDRELVAEVLAAAGLACQFTYAQTQKEFEAALARGELDLILGDFTLPSYDGKAALTAAHRALPEVPFIFVSGTIGEERAVESLKRGATDYVLKPRLDLLVPAVVHALAEAEEHRKRREAEESLRESEAEFRAVFDAAGDGMFVLDLESQKCVISNAACSRMLGYTPEEFLNMAIPDLHPPEDFPFISEQIGKFLKGEVGVRHDIRFKRRDGSMFFADLNPALISLGGRKGVLIAFRDITERKRAEQALRQSEERFSKAFHASPIAQILSQLPDGRILDVNESFLRQGGYRREELVGHTVLDADVYPDSVERERLMRRLLAQRSVSNYECQFRTRSGEARDALYAGELLELGGKPCVLALVQDITERKRAELTANRLAAIVEASDDCIIGKDLDGIITSWNRGAEKMFGYTAAEMVGASILRLIPAERQAEEHHILERIKQGKSVEHFETVRQTKDGRLIGVSVTASPITDAADKVVGVSKVARDITERKQAEQKLRDSEALYQSLVENLPQHVFRKDLAGRFTFGNGPFCQSLGKPLAEILGKTDLDFCPPALAEKYRQDDQRVIETGQPFQGDEEHRQASGKTIFVHVIKTPLRDAAGQIIGVQGISWDITERKQTERQMQRAQRLESIGTLAGGVAHDLNNALAPIMMAGELLRLEYPDTAAHYLELIQSSAKRGADMVKQLLTFAKGVEGERLLAQPKHLLNEMGKLINSTFPKSIEVRTRCPNDLWTVLGDATQLHQVLLNLCVNARDAMPEGGTLTLEAENQELDAAYASTVLEAKPGRYVVWRVTDTGTGIPPEILDRIFDPFFTTKGPDKGTGLGLSTTLGIVKGHGGFIRVYSTPGQGSTFAVYLPAYGFGTEDAALLTQADTDFRGKGETILVVDDEAAVRNLLREVLTKLNFKVLTAGDGAVALIQVAEQETELHAVITDLHMPHMDGLSFVRVLRARRPRAGILVVSGRLDERAADEFKKLGVTALLDKPFTREKLVEALKSVFEK